jgi:hypothetical protein
MPKQSSNPRSKKQQGKKVKKPARDVNVNQTVHVHVTKRRSAPRQTNPFVGVRSGNPMHQYHQSPAYANQFSSFASRAHEPPHNLQGSINASPFANVRASPPMMVSIGSGPDASRLAPELLYPRVASVDMPSSVPRRVDYPPNLPRPLPSTILTTYEAQDSKEDPFNFASFVPDYKQSLQNTGFVNNPSTNPADWLYGNYPEQHYLFNEFNIRNPFSAPVATQSPEAQLPQSMLALEYKPDNQVEEEPSPPIATASASDRVQEKPADMLMYNQLNSQYNFKELQEYSRSVGLAPGKKYGRSKDDLLRRLVQHLSIPKL